jgi:hypothetical protein
MLVLRQAGWQTPGGQESWKSGGQTDRSADKPADREEGIGLTGR